MAGVGTSRIGLIQQSSAGRARTVAFDRGRRLRGRLRGARRVAQKQPAGEAVAKFAVNWLFFWLVAGVTIVKDLVDVAFTIIEGATTATVIGIPVAIFFAIIGAIMTLTVSILTATYHIFSRRSVGVKIAISSIGLLIGVIPVLNLLPESFLLFCASNVIGTGANLAKRAVTKMAAGAVGAVTR